MEGFWEKFKHNRNWQVGTVIGVLAIAAIVLGAILWFTSSDNQPVDEPVDTNDEQTVARRIDGVQVAEDAANVPVMAVIIENLATVRPQSGLGQAQVVYETLAEGGITRFLVLFATKENIDPIGPVRSARHYFVDWAEEYGGGFMHVGGSPQALGILNSTD